MQQHQQQQALNPWPSKLRSRSIFGQLPAAAVAKTAVAAPAAPDDTAELAVLLERRRQSSVHSRRLLTIRRDSSGLGLSRRLGAGVAVIDESQLSEEELEKRRRRIAQLRFRLRFFLKLVVTANKLCDKHHLTCQRMGDAFRSQQEEVARAEDQLGMESQQGSVYFSKAEYRANRQMRLSAEARRILRKRWDARTEAEVNYTVIALRSIQQIADYPVRMQKNLARFGMLESFNPGRIIVRQADPAQAFYFVLYGTVIVAVLDKSAESAQTVVELKRGDSFGELAIMNRSKRQSTVISKTDCDLLSVGIDDYEATFMQGGQKTLTDPDHSQFIESLDFLQGWPKEHLQQQHDNFRFCYFKRSTVMIKNSSKSKWIYIIKSGSARVLLVLKRVTPQVASDSGALLPRCRTTRQRRILGSTDSPDNADFSATAASPTSALDAFYDSAGVYSPDCISATEAPYPRTLLLPTSVPAWLTADVGDQSSGGATSAAPVSRQRPLTSSTPLQLTSSCRRRPAMDARSKTMSNLIPASVLDAANAVPEDAIRTPATADKEGIKLGRKTFLDDLDAGQVEMTHQPEFVHIQTLTRGSVFGLQDMFKSEQPSLCVVSNGAECLLLDKEFFLEHSSRALLDRLRNQVTHYPSRRLLQTRLQERVNWEAYKRLVVHSAAVRHRGRAK